MLLEAGVSALPVVDDKRCLLDVYARGDITALARGNAYNRLQWEDVTVRNRLIVPTVCVCSMQDIMPACRGCDDSFHTHLD